MTKTRLSLKVFTLFVICFAIFGSELKAQEETSTKKEWISDDDMLKDAPLKQEESVYLVLNARTTVEMLQTARQEFKKRGGQFNYSNINFTEDGLLEQVKISMIAPDGKKAQKTWSREGDGLGEKMIVILKHNHTRSTVYIQQGNPDYGHEVSNKIFKKFVGIAILSKEEEAFLKGIYAINTDTDLKIGVNSKMKITHTNN